MATRAEVLAERIEQGAEEFIAAVESLSDEQWQTPCGSEQRSVGVLVHHVGTMYPIEADVVRMLAENGEAPGVDWPAVHGINADHATTNAAADKSVAIALVRNNVQAAVETVRGLSDAQLDRVAPNALAWNAPMTVQNFIENHPIAHPYSHLESIQIALNGA
ncbi:MAG TPA: DinB family protein [Thermomicrobiales bacterium]|nr:DinB family protein [Thermomicrobiales bacterium]